MGILEIVLLLLGGAVFTAGFLIPFGKEKASEETGELIRREIETQIADKMESVRNHVSEVVDEAVEYSMEKTERSLERLSNEKIMAVSEYSDTVLQEIHKNHEEAMFLYDMLNDKHMNLKNTVTEINRTVREAEETRKEAEETRKEAEAAVHSFQRLSPEYSGAMEAEEDLCSDKEIWSDAEADCDACDNSNSNDKILQLRRQGKSKTEIARELGLGVGEVKLVIDLFHGQDTENVSGKIKGSV